jgi:hypothetical protein
VLSLLVYWFVPIGIIYLFLEKIEKIAGKSITKRSILDLILVSLAGIFVIFSHSVGPIRTIIDYLKSKYLGSKIIKLKTER